MASSASTVAQGVNGAGRGTLSGGSPSPSPSPPPGPGLPRLVQTLTWGLAPTWAMRRWAARLGDTFTITFWPSGLEFVLLSDPDAVKTVMTAPAELAPSGTGSSPIAPVLGRHSVIVLTGPEHMRQRKLLLPPFHGERMREYEQVIVQATRDSMAQWPLGTPMELSRRTRQITLEVILRAVFGVDADRMDALRTAISELLEPMRTVVVLQQLLTRPSGERPGGAIGRALDRLDGLIYGEIANRRQQSDLEERNDILSLLMQATDEDGRPMDEQELRDELVSLLLAGHETTATAVAWAIERLVRHPLALRRLVDEIDAGEGDAYANAVVNETLRVRPVVPIVVRTLTADMQVGRYVLPAGTRVAPSIVLTNRNPRVYEDPDEFRPERFLESAPDTFAWIPFGGGIRRCIGASFAQLEMKLILRTVLSELEPGVPQDGSLRSRLWSRGEWTRRRAITLVPAGGARVVWRRRAIQGA